MHAAQKEEAHRPTRCGNTKLIVDREFVGSHGNVKWKRELNELPFDTSGGMDAVANNNRANVTLVVTSGIHS